MAASTIAGKRAFFSNTGSQISLAAPGDNVFGAIASTSSKEWWPRYTLPGSSAGLYGWSSGTSFSTPEVAGAAALVWAANPSLTAQQVAAILKATASGGGKWSPRLGYGIIDVAAAVASAQGHALAPRKKAGAWLSLHRVSGRGFRSVRFVKRRPNRLRPLRIAVHLRTSAPLVTPDYRTITLQVQRGRQLAPARPLDDAARRRHPLDVGMRPGRYVLRAVTAAGGDSTARSGSSR